MIGPATGTRIFLACGHTDMRRGMDGLAALVQQALVRIRFVVRFICFAASVVG